MYIPRTNSTNTLLRELIAAGNPPEFIYTGFQTAGRGQAGNGWESEEGKNLLCSILLPPREPLFDQNVLISVAVHKVVAQLLQQSGLTAKRSDIKWPNDIYWQNRKVAGILVENAIVGNEVQYSIAGIGLNVNQTEFVSGAPNPVSMKQISGEEYEIDAVMNVLLDEIHEVSAMPPEEVWDYYKAHLYRREGFWPFVEREVSVVPTMNVQSDDVQCTKAFLARIEDILPTGEILLEDQEGKQRKYHFKQIRYVL